jgi:hypothetical protein
VVAMDAAAERMPRRDEFIDPRVVRTDSSASASSLDAAHRAMATARPRATGARRSAREDAGRNPDLVEGATPAMCATVAMSATCTVRCECVGEGPSAGRFWLGRTTLRALSSLGQTCV